MLFSSHLSGMPIRPLIFVLLALCAGAAFAQSSEKETTVIAAVIDRSGLPIAGVSLFVTNADAKPGYGFGADMSGRVELKLRKGTNEITANRTVDAEFKLYILILESGPVPNNIQIVLNPQANCCTSNDRTDFPIPLSLPKPPYPPAARAVRARGEVMVEVEVGENGSVTNATALTGHPLLRAASAAAARKSRFEVKPSLSGSSLLLTYAFFSDDEVVATKLRHTNPYRIEVVAGPVEIDTLRSH